LTGRDAIRGARGEQPFTEKHKTLERNGGQAFQKSTPEGAIKKGKRVWGGVIIQRTCSGGVKAAIKRPVFVWDAYYALAEEMAQFEKGRLKLGRNVEWFSPYSFREKRTVAKGV